MVKPVDAGACINAYSEMLYHLFFLKETDEGSCNNDSLTFRKKLLNPKTARTVDIIGFQRFFA